MLKNRIMQTVDSENEGIKTMAFKFLEMLIICQLPKSEVCFYIIFINKDQTNFNFLVQ
jgi:hypothetical protein